MGVIRVDIARTQYAHFFVDLPDGADVKKMPERQRNQLVQSAMKEIPLIWEENKWDEPEVREIEDADPEEVSLHLLYAAEDQIKESRKSRERQQEKLVKLASV